MKKCPICLYNVSNVKLSSFDRGENFACYESRKENDCHFYCTINNNKFIEWEFTILEKEKYYTFVGSLNNNDEYHIHIYEYNKDSNVKFSYNKLSIININSNNFDIFNIENIKSLVGKFLKLIIFN